MLSSWSTIAPTPLAEHEIVLFYDVDGIDITKGPQIAFAQLLTEKEDDAFPSDQREALGGRYGSEPLWRQAAPRNGGKTEIAVGEDLHPHIREIISGARVDLATRWLPTDNARRLLTTADLYPQETAPVERVKKIVVFEHVPAAEKRLAAFDLAPRRLKLTIEALDLILFSTGKAFAQARAAFLPLEKGAPLCALELLEAIHALSRFNRFRWYSDSAGFEAAPMSDAFALGALIRGLCLGQVTLTRPSGRVFTYVLARFDAPLPAVDADLFALHAARHYTTDYILAPDLTGFRRVRDFETVGHTVALEGAATIISPPAEGGPIPEFLRTFKAHAFQAHYAPIALLALHEHRFLVEKTSTALLTPEQRGKPEEVRKNFLQLTRDSLDFRIFFRHSEVSFITMHNALNRAFREVLGLDRMLMEFSGDVAEIADFLQRQDSQTRLEQERRIAQAEHERGRRFWFLSVLGTGVLAALTVSTLVKEGLESWKFLRDLQEQGAGAWRGGHGPDFIAFVVGIVILLGACFVGFIKRPRKRAAIAANGHDKDDFIDHAGAEFLIHRHRE